MIAPRIEGPPPAGDSNSTRLANRVGAGADCRAGGDPGRWRFSPTASPITMARLEVAQAFATVRRAGSVTDNSQDFKVCARPRCASTRATSRPPRSRPDQGVRAALAPGGAQPHRHRGGGRRSHATESVNRCASGSARWRSISASHDPEAGRARIHRDRRRPQPHDPHGRRRRAHHSRRPVVDAAGGWRELLVSGCSSCAAGRPNSA
jgi:hypothetical protein